MKKIAFVLFLMAVSVAAGRAQESRQDISLSGTGLIEPFKVSSTNVEVSANRAFGALLSYRFMLTPSSALEANYQITYKNNIHYYTNTGFTNVNTRTQEISAAYVRSFVFKNFNPFVEAGPGAFIFMPIRNMGIAYEISPSFDIRAEYRGWITKVPKFGNTNLGTNRWYNIYNPVIGVAYHF
jgi:outer membrane immunogenic protein